MCGFAGIIGKTLETETLQKGMASIRHRGPDSEGIERNQDWVMLHTRLSIIDLSPNGSQPMKDSRTGVTLVFNGEIYNYRELIQNLPEDSFVGKSDTEVLLRLYLREGIQCVSKLRGMFAFAIHDPRNKKTFLVRDRFGIKPLYYFFDGKVLIFGSEIKPILSFGVKPELNLQVVYDFLENGFLAHNEETFFKEIRSLPAASVLEFHENKMSIQKYWDLPHSSRGPLDFKEAEEKLYDKLLESVRLHLISDVPVGISLSSGLDSQILTYFLSKVSGGNFHTFTFGYADQTYDEIIKVEKTRFPISLTRHQIRMDPETMIHELEQAIHFFEMPLGGLGTLSATSLMRHARKAGIKTLISGEGSDEIFAGYKYYFYSHFRDLYESNHPGVLERELEKFNATGQERLEIGNDSFKRLVLNETRCVRAPDGSDLHQESFLGKVFSSFQRENSGRRQSFEKKHLRKAMAKDLFEAKLPKLLWFQDRASMSSGVETRVPFLDHELAEFAWDLPEEFLIRNGSSKFILKSMLKNIFGVDYLGTTKHYVATPQREWLKWKLQDKIIAYLDKGILASSDLIDYPKFKSAYQSYSESKELGNSFFVWKILNLEILLRQFFPVQ